MPYKKLLGHPLEIDTNAPPKLLEECVLYPEFAERFADALDLIDEGQDLWESFYVGGQGWAPLASNAVSAVSSMAFNIRQSFNRYPEAGLANAIRHSRLDSTGVSDAQLVAALAMDNACRAIQCLWGWIDWIEDDARKADPARAADMSMGWPDTYLKMINDHRASFPHLEIEARESTAIYMGDARNYMTLAHVYAAPTLSDEVKARISRQAVTESRREISRKGSDKSAEVRKGVHVDRDAAICKKGLELKSSTGTERGIAPRIARNAVGAGLSAKQIQSILVAGKVLSRPEKKRK